MTVKALIAIQTLIKELSSQGIYFEETKNKKRNHEIIIEVANVYRMREGLPPYKTGWINAQRYCQRIVSGEKPEKQKSDSPVNKAARGQETFMVEGIDVRTPAFLETRAWKKLRYQALCKHGAKCQCCGAGRDTGAVINVDHIKPRIRFPELALKIDNLQILCADCNAGKGNWDETDWRRAPRTADDTLDLAMLSDLREHGLLN